MSNVANCFVRLAKIALFGSLLGLSGAVFAQNFVFFNDNTHPSGYLKAKVGCYKEGYWAETNWITPGRYDYFRNYVFNRNCPSHEHMTIEVADVQNNCPFVNCKAVPFYNNNGTQCFSIKGYGTNVSCERRSCYGFMVKPM